MTLTIFNASLLLALLLIAAGCGAQWGWPVALIVAGVLLLLLTLLLVRWAGVRQPNPRERHVPDRAP